MIKYCSFCILFLLFLGSVVCCRAQQPDVRSLFETANKNATSKEYNKAIDQYKKIASRHGLSAPLLFNLANCYAETGDVGRAVLNYERALRLDPGNSDIQENLAQIRKDAGLYRDRTPLYERFASLLGADQWLMLTGAGFFILSLTLFVASCKGIPASFVRWTVPLCLLLILCSLPPALLQYRQWDEGIIIGNNATLLVSPFEKASPIGKLSAGRRVRIKKRHGDFFLINEVTGQAGWLTRQHLAIITNVQDLQ